jgi:hypothetical protein
LKYCSTSKVGVSIFYITLGDIFTMLNTLQTKTSVGEDRLIDNVFAIIDSRIQYLEYEKEKLVNNCMTDSTGSHSSDHTNLYYSNGTDSLLHRFDRMQERISNMSRSVRLLLFIRSLVLKNNAKIALNLLTDHTYLKYSEEHIYHILFASRTIN